MRDVYLWTNSARLDIVLSMLSHPLEDDFLDVLLAVQLWLRGHKLGPPFVVVSLAVPRTWFNSGLIELSPSLDEVSRGDIPPTPPMELGASR